MSGILFLCHRFPYPPNKGDKIRSYHILKKLNETHDVYLGALVDDPLDWVHVPTVRSWVVDSCIVERRRFIKHWPSCLSGIVKGKSISNVMFYSEQLQLWIDGLIKTGKISTIYVFSSAMAQYVLSSKGDIPMITDFVDVDSAKWQDYASSKRFPLNVIYRLEARQLKTYEKKVANASKASIFVSSQEAQIFKNNLGPSQNTIVSIQNGVDASYYDPTLSYPNPYQGTAKKILFTGLMDYWPNVDAVTWFVNEVFVKLRKYMPHIEFYICGANPNKSVFKLCKTDIRVTGRVPDIRPYLQHADLVVAPLRIARGVQNKVLEALSMQKQIVASPAALEGIKNVKMSSLWQENTAQEWLERIITILNGPQSIFDSHSWIIENYSWNKHLIEIDALINDVPMIQGQEL